MTHRGEARLSKDKPELVTETLFPGKWRIAGVCHVKLEGKQYVAVQTYESYGQFRILPSRGAEEERLYENISSIVDICRAQGQPCCIWFRFEIVNGQAFYYLEGVAEVPLDMVVAGEHLRRIGVFDSITKRR
jgi:hypothetical protein